MIPLRLQRLLAAPKSHNWTKFSSTSTNCKEGDILFNVRNNMGIVTLNNPKSLHCLNINMVKSMLRQVREWDGKVDLILVESSGGRAFCSGGDVVGVRNMSGLKIRREFVEKQYQLHNLTATLSSPYIALIHGITMGGGFGISFHGPVRVATENTMIAMPESRIGLVPDAGSSYFFTKSLGSLGMFLALTGYRLKGEDCLHVGIATHLCPAKELPQLREDLLNLKTADELNGVLDGYVQKFPLKNQFSLEEKMPLIHECFSQPSVEEVLGKLDDSGEWGRETSHTIKKMSPVSTKLAFKLIHEARKMDSLSDCLKMEYRLIYRCQDNDNHYEGIRALLVDKDKSPKWNPSSLEAVSDELVDEYFQNLPESEELKL